MGQNAALTLNNGAATPVAKTFSIEQAGYPNGQFSWADMTSGIFNQLPRVKLKYSPASAARATIRHDFETVVPVVRSVNSVLTTVGNNRVITQVVIDPTSTEAERADLHAFHKNAWDNALVKNQIVKYDAIS